MTVAFKHLAIIVFLACLTVLSACGGGTNSSNTTEKPKNTFNREKPSDNNGNNTSDAKAETSFTLAIIPDTQKYAQKYPAIFESQTRWIAANYKKENIKFSAHLGDIVENPNSHKEWFNAVRAMSHLDKNPETPYSILAGNHDVPALIGSAFGSVTFPSHYDDKRNLKNEIFLKYFPASKQRKNFKTFKGAFPITEATTKAKNTSSNKPKKTTEEHALNSYHIFADDDGQKWLVLSLDWRTSDATHNWVENTVFKKHPNLPVILITHELLDPRVNKGQLPKWTANGKRLWEKLIKNNDQIFITFNGHWNGEGYRIEKNNCGRDVILMAVDYQNGIGGRNGDHYNGGNGMLQLVRFNKASNRLDFRSYSPYVQEKLNIVSALPNVSMHKKDELERWKFQIPVDFKERFSNFNKASNCSK